MFKSIVSSALIASVAGKVYFQETFSDDDWTSRWTQGDKSWQSGLPIGKFVRTKGEYTADEGIQTSQDAHLYSLTAPLSEEFDNKDKDLIISYSVKHEQNLECGGAYLKLVKSGYDPKTFGGNTPYNVMFGPDLCGTTRKTHAIFNYKDTNLENKKHISGGFDDAMHRYTLIVHPDNTYEVLLDQEKIESGSLEEDYSFLPPKTIPDPDAKKPEDWVNEPLIADPDDVKPEGYDDIPAKIPDPDSVKPDDWDEEEDGEWETPLIDNPEYKGPWTPKMIPNPAYKGPWVHPEIPNPVYEADETLYNVCNPCVAVGFELWQVQAGTIFDDIIVTDSLEDLASFEEKTFNAKKAKEEELLNENREQRRKASQVNLDKDLGDLPDLSDFDLEFDDISNKEEL